MAKRNSSRMNGWLIPAVGYIRMSTDRQEHSPQRQRAEIELLAAREGYRIIKWYEDQGLTGTESANRPEFQQLLRDAQRGRFKAILLHEQSRFSREDIFDVMVHWRLLREAGVEIVTCQRGHLRFDDLGGIITAIIDQHGAREESVKLAHRVASGQRQRAKQGKRIGGIVFGYDRELYDDQGKFVRRVHFRERFRRPPTWTSNLVPSDDVDAVEAVQWAFEAIHQGYSVGHVVRGLNERGQTTTYGNPFSHGAVTGMLSNRAYAGTLVVGRYSRAKFCRVDEEGLIVVDNAHEPLVSVEVFEEVQAILARRKRHHERSEAGTYLLSGLIACHHCGNRMYGVPRKERNGKSIRRQYECMKSPLHRRFDPNCPHPAVHIERLEAFVLNEIRRRVLETNAADRVKDAIVRAKARKAVKTSHDEKRLKQIRQKIERGTENLALASHEDFTAISRLLMKWREEEAEIVDRIQRQEERLAPLPEAIDIIARFSEMATNLETADRVKLAHAVKQTVTSISIGCRPARTGDVEHTEYFGELRLHEALGDNEPIPIPDTARGYRKIWRELGDLVQGTDHPLHLADFAEHIGTKDLSHASYHVRRATSAGLIRKLGHQGGWVAAD